MAGDYTVDKALLLKERDDGMVWKLSYQRGNKLVAKMLAIIVACESLVMVILHQLQWLGPWSVVLDPLLLFLIAAPVLYYLVTPTMGATFLLPRRIEEAFGEGGEGPRWFRDLIDQTDDIITIVEPHTARLLGVNESFARITGYSRAELLTLFSSPMTLAD